MCSRFCQSLVCTLKPVPLVKGVACAVAGRTLISSVCAMLRLRPRSRQFVTGKSVLWTSLLTLSLTSKKIVWTTISSEPPLYFGLKDTDSASSMRRTPTKKPSKSVHFALFWSRSRRSFGRTLRHHRFLELAHRSPYTFCTGAKYHDERRADRRTLQPVAACSRSTSTDGRK